MVIIAENYGQLGNQLFGYAFLLGNAIAHDYECGTNTFGPYRHLFDQARRSPLFRYPETAATEQYLSPLPKSLFKRLAGRAWRRDGLTSIGSTAVIDIRRTCDRRVEHFLLESDEFQEIRRRHKRTYLLGYFFRDTPHLFEHREAITRHLRPAECHRQDVQDFMTAFRDKKCTLVGVHIRRGDYKDYLGGRYYYENATYARWMGQIQDSVPGPVQFLVASTDPIDDNDFEGLPIIKAPGNIVGDMFTLAECDLIMGPPSSFSGWASFQRLTPLLHLRERDHDVQPELFAPLNLETAP